MKIKVEKILLDLKREHKLLNTKLEKQEKKYTKLKEDIKLINKYRSLEVKRMCDEFERISDEIFERGRKIKKVYSLTKHK